MKNVSKSLEKPILELFYSINSKKGEKNNKTLIALTLNYTCTQSKSTWS